MGETSRDGLDYDAIGGAAWEASEGPDDGDFTADGERLVRSLRRAGYRLTPISPEPAAARSPQGEQ